MLHSRVLANIPRNALRGPRVPKPSHSRVTIITLAAIAALLVGMVTSVIWREIHQPVERANAVSSPLSLRAEQAGEAVRVYWERSLAQRKANSGVLLIFDGEETIRRVVGPAEIQGGGLSYRPVTGDVTFLLSAYGPGGFAASQVLRWIEPSHPDSQPVVRHEASNRPPARRTRVMDTKDHDDILPPKKPVRQSPFPPQEMTVAAVVAPLPAPASEPVHKTVEAPAPKHVEKPAPPRRPEVAESMPVTDAGEEPSDRRGLKKSLRWLGAKTSRIWSFGRKPASD
jgi:hypothetical protein